MAGILLPSENVTEEERAAFARKTAEENRRVAIERMAEAERLHGAEKRERALAIPGNILRDTTMEPGANHYIGKLPAGTRLRIIDLGGQQAVDFLCFNRANTEVRYNNANTLKLNGTIYISKGFKLYSDIAEVLMTLVEDTVGHHDTLGGACSNQVNYLRYGIKDTCSCRDNFLAAMAELGLSARDVHQNINFFMNVPVRPDGSTQIEEGLSVPWDFVELEAAKDVIVVISNCPQLYNPCSGWNPTPIRILEWQP
jgi:urea carboxylase-associated protein 1